MATVLHDVMTAEMRSLIEPAIVPHTTGSGSILIDNDIVRSGLWEYEKSSRPTHYGVLNPSDECIVGAWINTRQLNGDSALITGWVSDPGDPTDWALAVYVAWNVDDYQFELVVDDTGPWGGAPNLVLQATVSQMQTGINRKAQWMHLGLYAKKAATDIISVYLDGQQILTWTSSGSEWAETVEVWDFISAISIGSTGINAWTRLDDMYSADVTGDGDQVPPALRFFGKLPDGAGSSTQWTPDAGSNYARVNETTAPDNDTTYVETAVVAQKDLYTCEDLAAADLAESYTIGEVIMQSQFKNVDDTEITEIEYEHVVNDGALESVDGTFSNTTLDTWTFAKSIFPLQPDGSAWNLADFNSWTYGLNSK